MGSNARAVLSLIRDERADAVIHAGDFDYEQNPAAWDAQINDILGADFAYFACLALNEVDGRKNDCDLFDDGQANGSCQ